MVQTTQQLVTRIAVILFVGRSTNVSLVGAFASMELARQFILSRGNPTWINNKDNLVSAQLNDFELYAVLVEVDRTDREVLEDLRDDQTLVILLAGHPHDGHRWVERACRDMDSAQRYIQGRCTSIDYCNRHHFEGWPPTVHAEGKVSRETGTLRFEGTLCSPNVPVWLPGEHTFAATPEALSVRESLAPNAKEPT